MLSTAVEFKYKWLCEYRGGRYNSLDKSGKIPGVTTVVLYQHLEGSLGVLQTKGKRNTPGWGPSM